MENYLFRNSLFSSGEMKMHRDAERDLIIKARNNNPNPLLDFWRGKRKAMLIRAMEGGFYDAVQP